MSNDTLTAPYIKIPQVVCRARETGVFSPEQFNILVYCYFKVNRTQYEVCGYSAERVCEFLGLDTTDKSLIRRYERAAAKLWKQDVIRRDYRRLPADPSSPDKGGRPYSVWVPRPERFQEIGTRDENTFSLWYVGDIVGNLPVASHYTSIISNEEVIDIVGMIDDSSHESPKTREKDPPSPPKGGVLPPPPPPAGERSGAAGLENIHRKSNAAGRTDLSPEQSVELNTAALAYIQLIVQLYKFSPNKDHVQSLLRIFKPTELLFAQLSRFETYGYRKADLAHFFRKAARDSIEAARLQGTSAVMPDWFQLPDSYRFWQPIAAQWEGVLAAWNKASIDGRHDSGFVFEPPKPPKPPTNHKNTVTKKITEDERLDSLVSQVITYAESLDSRVMMDAFTQLGQAKPSIKKAIMDAEAEHGGLVTFPVLSAIIKHQIAEYAKNDVDSFHSFGMFFCKHLASRLRKKAGEQP